MNPVDGTCHKLVKCQRIGALAAPVTPLAHTLRCENASLTCVAPSRSHSECDRFRPKGIRGPFLIEDLVAPGGARTERTTKVPTSARLVRNDSEQRVDGCLMIEGHEVLELSCGGEQYWLVVGQLRQ